MGISGVQIFVFTCFVGFWVDHLHGGHVQEMDMHTCLVLSRDEKAKICVCFWVGDTKHACHDSESRSNNSGPRTEDACPETFCQDS